MKKILIKRKLLEEITRFLPRKEIFAVLGPRQAGKTTLLQMTSDWLKTKKKIPQSRIFHFNLEDPLARQEFEAGPQEFIGSRLQRRKTYFFLDEFHYSKEGGKKLKLLFDTFPGAKIFVSGSSSLELTFATAQYLVGRVFYFRLFPLDFEEFLAFRTPDLLTTFLKYRQWQESFLDGQPGKMPKSSVFDPRMAKLWEEFVTFGGYPEVVKTADKETKIKILENIVSTYLQREIRSLLLIEDLGSYQNLLKILASQSGELLNLTHLSNDTDLHFLLLKKYLKILEETFVIKRVAPFYHNLSSELRKNVKVYFWDHGLRNLLLNSFSLLSERPDRGKIGETFIFQQVGKRLKPNEKLNFWRTRGGAEVDFVLTRGVKEIPLEVKVSRFDRPKLSRSLNSFLSAYQPERGVVFNKNLWQVVEKKGTKVLFAPLWYG